MGHHGQAAHERLGGFWDCEELQPPFVAKLVIGRRITDGRWVAWEVGSKRLHGPFRTCQAAAEAGTTGSTP